MSVSRIVSQNNNDLASETVSFKNEHLGHEKAALLAEALKRNSTVKHLNLSGSRLGISGVKAIAEMLKLNTTITHIDLSRNHIAFEGALLIGDALRVNRTVKEINLNHCQLGDGGVQYLVHYLLSNEIIARLSLLNNQFSEQGALAFIKALKAEKLTDDLTTLTCEDTLSPIAIAKILENSSKVKKLGVNISCFRERAVEGIELLETLVNNSTVERLTISSYTHSDEDVDRLNEVVAPILSNILANNKTIKQLHFYEFAINKQCVSALIEGIKNNMLESIRVSVIGVDDDAASRIDEALQSNNRILHAEIMRDEFSIIPTRHFFAKPIINRLFACIKEETQRVFWSFGIDEGRKLPLFLKADLATRCVIEKINNPNSKYYISTVESSKLSSLANNPYLELFTSDGRINVKYLESLVFNAILVKAKWIESLRLQNQNHVGEKRRRETSSSSSVSSSSTLFNAPQAEAEADTNMPPLKHLKL